MNISGTVKENVAYTKELVESGLEGAKEARRAVLGTEGSTDLVHEAAQEAWQAGAIGIMVGAVLGVLADDRKPIRGVIAGVVIGALAGYGGAFAWKTRPLTSAMARGAGRRVETVRDKHWLQKNPVPYG
jgi:hypothetical protein